MKTQQKLRIKTAHATDLTKLVLTILFRRLAVLNVENTDFVSPSSR